MAGIVFGSDFAILDLDDGVVGTGVVGDVVGVTPGTGAG